MERKVKTIVYTEQQREFIRANPTMTYAAIAEAIGLSRRQANKLAVSMGIRRYVRHEAPVQVNSVALAKESKARLFDVLNRQLGEKEKFKTQDELTKFSMRIKAISQTNVRI